MTTFLLVMCQVITISKQIWQVPAWSLAFFSGLIYFLVKESKSILSWEEKSYILGIGAFFIFIFSYILFRYRVHSTELNNYNELPVKKPKFLGIDWGGQSLLQLLISTQFGVIFLMLWGLKIPKNMWLHAFIAFVGIMSLCYEVEIKYKHTQSWWRKLRLYLGDYQKLDWVVLALLVILGVSLVCIREVLEFYWFLRELIMKKGIIC